MGNPTRSFRRGILVIVLALWGSETLGQEPRPLGKPGSDDHWVWLLGRSELVVPLNPQSVGQDPLEVTLGDPVAEAAGAPVLRFAKSTVTVSQTRPFLRAEVLVLGKLTPGVWAYTVPVRAREPLSFAPTGSLRILGDSSSVGKHPELLTSNTRVWPVRYKVDLSSSRKRGATRFEFQLPGQSWAQGQVRVENAKQPVVEARFDGVLAASRALPTGFQPVRFRLADAAGVVREWVSLVQVGPSHLDRPILYQQDEGKPLALPDNGSLLVLNVPRRLAVLPRFVPMTPRVGPTDVFAYVQRDTAAKSQPGPLSVQVIRLWLDDPPRDVKTCALQDHASAEPTSILHFPSHWGNPGQPERFLIALRARYRDGCEEWTSATVVEMNPTEPARQPQVQPPEPGPVPQIPEKSGSPPPPTPPPPPADPWWLTGLRTEMGMVVLTLVAAVVLVLGWLMLGRRPAGRL